MAQAGMTAEAIVDALPPGIDPSLIADLEAIRAAVLAQATEAVVIDLDLTLVRGMGYYTGPIFEIEHPGFPGSIAGGGRYDDMVGRFLQRPVPACGISLGFERLVEVVTQETSSQEKRLAFVFERDSAALTDLSREARKLRDDGYIVEPIQGKSSVSRKRLSADGYEFVVIAGSGDVPERLVPQVDRPPASA
jgi:histidyl-tRNA synthetase